MTADATPVPSAPAPVVSCDFTFLANAAIRQVCAGRTADIELACDGSGPCRLRVFIPGTHLGALKVTEEKTRVLRRVLEPSASDMLELHLATPIRKNARLTLSLDQPPMTLSVLFSATLPEKVPAVPAMSVMGTTEKSSTDPATDIFQNRFIPALPPDPMLPAMEPAVTPAPTPPAMGGALPPDPE